MTYTQGALLAAVVAVVLDLIVLRTRLLATRRFWTSYAIIVFFQFVTNGLLTGLRIVRYDPERIVGLRIVWAPVEDLFFGFSMVMLTLMLWVRAGSVRPARDAGPTTPVADRRARR